MIQPAERLNNVQEYYFSRKLKEVARMNAEGKDIISLAIGSPDMPPSPETIEKLCEVAHDPDAHGYQQTSGTPELREAMAGYYKRWYGVDIDPRTEIQPLIGSKEGILHITLAFCNPGDKVVIFSPFYENYTADTILSGATPIYVPLDPHDFTFDANVLEDAMKQPGVKALVLCNPSNPSGKVFTREELQIIADLAIKYDLYVITDEVYEHIVFAPHRHTYIATLPGMRERTIECSSLSKSYSITGWRLGYVLAAEPVMNNIKKIHDFTVVGAASPLQETALTALNFGDDYYQELQAHYTHMKEIFTGGLRNLGFKFTEPQGTYFVMMDISEFGYKSDDQFCIDLAQKVGVAAVPGSSFFREPVNHLIRFHFAKKDETLYDALNRLESLRKKLKL